MDDLKPMPVELLARISIHERQQDGYGPGFTSGSFDSTTGILTLSFERAADDGEEYGDDPDFLHGDAEYQFQLVALNVKQEQS